MRGGFNFATIHSMNQLKSLGLHSTFEMPAIEKIATITEQFFGTAIDPEQIPVSETSREKMRQLSPYCFNTALDNNNNPVSWMISIPTTLELKEKFIRKEITEREMFEQTIPAQTYGALYLCMSFTIPEFRRKGIAKELIIETVEKFRKNNPDIKLFSWIYSSNGEKLVNSLPFKIERKVDN